MKKSNSVQTSINFFIDLSTTIDVHAEEVSFSFGTVEENLYNVKKLEGEYLEHFLSLRGKYFRDIPIDKIEAFSYQRKDNVVYKFDKIMVLLNGGKKDCFLFPELGVFDVHDDYCLNIFLDDDLTRKVKFYDLMFDESVVSILPKGSRLITHCGMGSSGNNIRDTYFINNDYSEVLDHFGITNFVPDSPLLRPIISDKTIDKVFGIAYDTETLEVKKVKFYYYPKSPKTLECLYDEIIE